MGIKKILRYLKSLNTEQEIIDLVRKLPLAVYHKGNKYDIYGEIYDIKNKKYLEVNYFNENNLSLYFPYTLFKTPKELYIFYKKKLNEKKL